MPFMMITNLNPKGFAKLKILIISHLFKKAYANDSSRVLEYKKNCVYYNFELLHVCLMKYDT